VLRSGERMVGHGAGYSAEEAIHVAVELLAAKARAEADLARPQTA
jgi:hypothetical protein